MRNNIAVAIDIGTTKIYVIIAEIDPETGRFQVLGYGTSTSSGLKKGLVVDVEQTSRDIKRAVRKAEEMAQIRVEKAFIGISGKHIQSSLQHIEIFLGEEPREIEELDYETLIQNAIDRQITRDSFILHKIAYNFKVDNGSVIKNPVGRRGRKVEADVHLITGSEKEITALKNTLLKLDIDVEEVILEPYASAKAVLTTSEKRFGTVIVDMGGGTTDICIYRNETLIYSAVIPAGGEHYTNDIAYCLQLDLETAEKLKKDFSSFSDNGENVVQIHIKNSNEKKMIEFSELEEIISSRTDDLLELVGEKIAESGFSEYISNGIVFTGGSSQIAGLKERAEEYFNYDIKIGIPIRTIGLLEEMNKPENSTGIGLLIYAAEKAVQTKTENAKYVPQPKQTSVEKKEEKDYGDEETEVVIEPLSEKIRRYIKKLF
jgi:cell division protein FtsA